MIPAHALFEEEANKRFQNNHELVDRLRHVIDIYQRSQEFKIQHPDLVNIAAQNQAGAGNFTHFQKWLDEETISLAHPLLIGYRYNYQPSSEIPEYKTYLNDSVFLPFEENQRDKAIEMQKDLYSYNMFRQDEIKRTISTNEVDQLQIDHANQTAVEVKGFTGYLSPAMDVEEYKSEGKGLRLRFLLNDRK